MSSLNYVTADAAGTRRQQIAEQLHDLRTPVNQIIGLSEMLIEIAEEDGHSHLLERLSSLREGGAELAGMLEEKHLFPTGVPNGTVFAPLAEMSQGSTDCVLRMSEEILSAEGESLSGEYCSDLNKIRLAARRFRDLVSGSTLMVPSRPAPQANVPPVVSRGTVTHSGSAESRILIVDDEDLNVEVLCRRLQREGYQPSGVSSGYEAMEMLESAEFDAILLDLLMPGMSGIEVLQRLKNTPRLQHIPVIMLSALSDVERVAKCIELGAEDYLPKPVNSTLLRARLGACLEKKRLRDQEQAYFRAMYAEKERLSVTLRSLADAVITTDAEGRITVLNDVCATFTALNRELAIGRSFEEVFPIVNRATGKVVASPVAQVLAQNRPFDCEPGISIVSTDGVERLVSVRSAPMHDQEGVVVGAVIVIRDITERERMAGELQRAAKLQSIGFLAGGLAHHYNNMLTAVLGNLSLLPHRWEVPAEAMTSIREAEQGASRAKDLTQYLLTFADGGAPIREAVQLLPLAEAASASATGASGVNYFSNLPTDLWELEGDPRQIAQVLDSIVTNAVEAMPGGGICLLDAENAVAPVEGVSRLAPGPYVRIRVQDHGTGIRPEDLPSVYDPFFTTKDHARGLGLSAAYSIVQRHGGEIVIDSTVGVGTTVTCYFPARPPGEVKPGSAKKKEEPKLYPSIPEQSATDESTRRKRVLVMDDEESIRVLVETMLTMLDFEVVTTSHGEEALEAHAEALAAGKPFDIALMDLRIPGGMGGGETMRRIRERDLEIKAIVASGYSDDPIMADHSRYGFNGALPKPFLLGELASALSLVSQSTGK